MKLYLKKYYIFVKVKFMVIKYTNIIKVLFEMFLNIIHRFNENY